MDGTHSKLRTGFTSEELDINKIVKRILTNQNDNIVDERTVEELGHLMLRRLNYDESPYLLKRQLDFEYPIKLDPDYTHIKGKTDFSVQFNSEFVLNIEVKTSDKKPLKRDFTQSVAQSVGLMLRNKDNNLKDKQQLYCVLIRGTNFYFYHLSAHNQYLDQLISAERLKRFLYINCLNPQNIGLDYKLNTQRIKIINNFLTIKHFLERSRDTSDID